MNRTSSIGAALILLLFSLLLAPGVFAQPNAEIINGDVHLRDSYPTFGVSTLFTFRLNQGTSLGIIKQGTRIEVLSEKIVANRYEWFEVVYTQNATQLRGWIYGGEVGKRNYIRLDPGVEGKLPKISTNFGGKLPNREETVFLFSPRSALAQSESTVKEPSVKTNPVSTLLFGTCYVGIFLGSLFTTKKWIFPNSNLYSFLTSLCILLILGFISDTVLSDIIARLLTPK